MNIDFSNLVISVTKPNDKPALMLSSMGINIRAIYIHRRKRMAYS
jgi:hypothetical protein